jgi:glutamate/tyrosine decarboxylase-like PLP-dependent enzyme
MQNWLRPARALGNDGNSATGWFLGPKAENIDILKMLVDEALAAHAQARETYQPGDPTIITDKVRENRDYSKAVAGLKKEAAELNRMLADSAPVFSMRSHGHMLWDQTLAAAAGYFSALLYNQNNVAAEASPVTTWLEMEVGKELCRMLGYRGGAALTPWGHITCDGSVANIEALWAARNAKFFATAVKAALIEVPELKSMAPLIDVRWRDGAQVRLIDLDPWRLLNVPMSETVALVSKIAERLPERDLALALDAANQMIAPFSLSELGVLDFYRRHGLGDSPAPVACAPVTGHYSWPKAGNLLGVQLHKVRVDLRARIDMRELERALEGLARTKTPVVAVVAVIGTTAESSLDPLTEILGLREKLREGYGLDFAVHCDAAWGGYFACCITSQVRVPEPEVSDYALTQYRKLGEADSITVDPHKGGFAPYPAGALCYRDGRTRQLIALKAPVVIHGEAEPTVGVFGVEGSKPGAAAASVYLSHKVVGLDRDGYGQIHRQCLWTSKRLYARLATMFDRDPIQPSPFRIAMFHKLPAERDGLGADRIAVENALLRKFVGLTNAQLWDLVAADKEVGTLFDDMGSDLTIVNYAFNFRLPDGGWNADVEACNRLNDKIYALCSVAKSFDPQKLALRPDLILTGSRYDAATFGETFVNDFGGRLGLANIGQTPLAFLISTTMNPWSTDTDQGDFLETVEKALRDAAYRAAVALGLAIKTV